QRSWNSRYVKVRSPWMTAGLCGKTSAERRRKETGVSGAKFARLRSMRTRLELRSVEVLHRERPGIHAFDAAHVDRGDGVALPVARLGIRMRAARGAEAVADRVLVEEVRGRVRIRGEEPELRLRDEPEERSLALAHRAIAGQHLADVALRLEGDVAAV